jgi:hypothetical protein
MQGSTSVALVLFLLAIPVSGLLIVSFAEIFDRRGGSSAAVRYLLGLVAHTILAVAFLRLTSGQPVGQIWWGHEIVLVFAFVAVAAAPRWRKLAFRLKAVTF